MKPMTTMDATSLEEKVSVLEGRLREVEARIPDSDIVSHSFWRRAWTVMGYYVAIHVVITVAGLGFMALAAVITALFQ